MSFIKLDDETYKKVIESVPIICVDLIVKWDDKFLLLKRTEEPLKDQWWVPGGRIMRGEDVFGAVERKLYEETRLEPETTMFVGFYQDVFETGHGVENYHSISLVFQVEPKHKHVKIDSTSSDYTWSVFLPERFKVNT